MRKLRFGIVLSVALAGGFCAYRAAPARAGDKAGITSADVAPASAALTNPVGGDAAPATTEATAAATSPELGLRFASLAQGAMRAKEITPAQFKEAAALLMAAMKLDPDEPRYPRMLYEAMLQLHDNQGALNAIKAFRSISLPGRADFEQPVNDQLMMVNYIDLTASMKQTAEDRLNFYKSILDTNAPDPVKSHCAFRASQLAHERGQDDLEDTLIGQSLKLNPLNMNALRVKLEQLTINGTALERVDVLQSMLKSNPVQPLVLYRLARELADAGLPEESLRYYTMAANLAGSTGTSLGREFALGYASELYMMGQAQLLVPAKEILNQLLRQDSGDVEGLLLLWLAERAGGAAEKENAAKTAQQLLNASLNRVLTLRQKIVGAENATTRPVDSPEALPIPDLSSDVEKLKDEKFDAIRQPYTQAVTDLAWYLVYAGGQAAQAEKLLPTLKALLPEKSPVLVRIEGWIFKEQGKLEPASIKLKAVADQDVFAQAGTLLIWAKNPAEKDAAVAAARKLMMEHSSGLLGAILLDSLQDLKIKVVERPDGAAIQESIKNFPRAWFQIINTPQAMYALKAEMDKGKVTFAFGEPMIARIYIKNICPYDITVGPEGVLRNDLWFDIALRGLVQQAIPGAAYDRFTQTMVLKPGEIMTQTVRLDQGQFGDVLIKFPNPSLTFYAHVRTNPRGDGSGPAGYDVQFSSITERSGFSVDTNSLRALTSQVATGSPTQRLRGLEMLGAELEQFRAQPESDQRNVIITTLSEILKKTMDDPIEAVATWGSFITAARIPDKWTEVMTKFESDPDPYRRLLGLRLAAGSLKPDEQKQMLNKMMEKEKDEMVKLYITGMLDQLRWNAENPTTAPSGSGATPTTAPSGTQPGPVVPIPGIEPPQRP
jgi:hypothetical protein